MELAHHSELCPCSELDWREVDMKLAHHPDCKVKNEININVQVQGSLIHESQLRNVIRNAVWRTRRISTAVYYNIPTGEAVNILLDALKIPSDKRRIAKGTETLIYWFVNNRSAFEVTNELVKAEGPGASFYEDENGDLVFETGGE